MSRTYFEKDLESLKLRLAEMCRMTEGMIENATRAAAMGDAELARRTVDADPAVDETEMEIETKCMRFLLKQQPVAGDFRVVSTILKVITDIERIGDQAADISAIVASLDGETGVAETHLAQMGRIAVAMVRDSVRSFLESDAALADRTVARDDEMDELFRSVRTEIVGLIRENPDCADHAVMWLMIAKYYERIGDHAVNVCEWTDYIESGVHRKF